MNPLVPKIIGGAVAVSTIGTGAYFGVKELSKGETVREKLAKENFRLISLSDNDQWDLEFDSDSAGIKKELGSTITTANLLKEKCQKMLDSRDDKNIEKVKKWCAIRSISNQLSRAGKKLLVDDKSSGSETDWKATYQRRKTQKTNRTKIGLTGEWGEPAADLEATDLPEIKKWCKKQESLDYSKNNKATYEAVEAGCTKEGASSEFK